MVPTDSGKHDSCDGRNRERKPSMDPMRSKRLYETGPPRFGSAEKTGGNKATVHQRPCVAQVPGPETGDETPIRQLNDQRCQQQSGNVPIRRSNGTIARSPQTHAVEGHPQHKPKQGQRHQKVDGQAKVTDQRLVAQPTRHHQPADHAL